MSDVSDVASDHDGPTPRATDRTVARLVLLLMLVLGLGGFAAFRLLSRPIEPPPAEVAADPLLLRGRAIYISRCLACHGADGKGDGQLASQLLGPPVGNLADSQWKYGDHPDQVRKIIRDGAPGSRMQGWGGVLDPPEVDAVAAYVYYLAHHPIPSALRKSLSAPDEGLKQNVTP